MNLDVAAGISSFSSLALNTSLSYERKNNFFTVRYFYNQPTKSVEPVAESGEDHRTWYGDRFRDVSLLYGRTYRKNKLMISLSCGIGVYKYTQSSLVNSNAYLTMRAFTDYQVLNKSYYGYGLASQADISRQVCQRTSLGLSLISNVNKERSILSLCAKLSFDISTVQLRDFKTKAD